MSERADPGTHGDLGIAYKQMGLYDAAIAEFKLLQADRTRAVFALTMIGECVEAKGELGEAVGKYKEALNLSAGDRRRSRWSSTTCWARCSSGWATSARRSTSSRTCASATPAFRDVDRRIAALKPANASQALIMTRHDARRSRGAQFFQELQDRITAGIEAADGGGRFREDAWTRPTGGGGRTRVLADGALFEKAGVAFSDVHGDAAARRWRARCPARATTSAPRASR